MQYLLSALDTLTEQQQKEIENNLSNIFQQKKKYRGKKFSYDCPFLLKDECCVYDYRGVVCRTFGLMTQVENQKVKAPFCSHLGLNYSNVLNLRNRTISPRKYKQLNTKKEPLGFNISYKYLTDIEFEAAFGFRFGEVKPLIEWFEN